MSEIQLKNTKNIEPKTLLLSANFEPIKFATYREVMILYVNNKLHVLESWDDYKITWPSGSMPWPAIVRFKRYKKVFAKKSSPTRKNVFRRDFYICQYCYQGFTTQELTLDHVIPSSRGGKDTWENLTSACFPCNYNKGSRTPEEAGLKLLSKPQTPNNVLKDELNQINPCFPNWKYYIK